MPNTGGLNAFTNTSTAYFINSSGNGTFQTGYLNPPFTSQNGYGLVNQGTILVANGGSLTLDSGPATTIGFSNTASGTVVVSNGSWLTVMRGVSSGWNGNAVANAGTILLQNGTIVTADSQS